MRHQKEVVILVLVLCIASVLHTRPPSITPDFTSAKPFPQRPIIFSFWDGPPSPTVNSCWQQWKRLNPENQCIMLTEETLVEWIPEAVDIVASVKKRAHKSDVIRIFALSTYGGVWVDASTFPLRPLADFLPSIPPGGLFIYHLGSQEIPFIENWFFASAPEAPIIQAWKNEFIRGIQMPLSRYGSYGVLLTLGGVDTSGIPVVHWAYLVQHLALQAILQRSPTGLSGWRIHTHPADALGGPLFWLSSTNWDTPAAISKLKRGDYGTPPPPFLKLHGHVRNVLDDRTK